MKSLSSRQRGPFFEFLLLLALLAAWTGERARAAAPEAAGATFSGTVRFEGRPVPRALVWLIGYPEKSWAPELASNLV